MPKTIEEEKKDSLDAIKLYNPTGMNLLCQPIDEGDKVGVIIIPDIAKKILSQAVVLKSGPEVDADLYPEGCIVIFTMHSDHIVSIGREKFTVVNIQNVMLIGPLAKKKEGHVPAPNESEQTLQTKVMTKHKKDYLKKKTKS